MVATTESELEDQIPSRSSRLFIILSVILLLAGTALGYFGVLKGLIPVGGTTTEAKTLHKASAELPPVAFVSIPTLIVTLPSDAKNTHLRFSAQIEVPVDFKSDVEFLMPRIQDLMNGYLRALTAEDIERPGALFEIRLQLFRRVVMVVGLGKVNGLLVTEFILN
jgi:flagellar FliL protein